MEVKINPEYEAILPKLSANDYGELKQSIKNEGLHYPIMVNGEGIILDGHHRFRICQELQLTGKFEVKQFSNPLLEKKFVIESNLLRRHLNKFQRAKLMLPLLEIEKVLAKERQWHIDSGGSAKYFPELASPKRTRKPLTEERKAERRLKAKQKKEAKKKAGIIPKKPQRALEIIANKIQLSDRTLEKAKEILEKGSLELQRKVENGETSISYAYQQVRRAEKHENPPPMPTEIYDVIYADPPWGYDLPLRGSPDMHYNTMSIIEICDLKIPSAEDSVLFLWATNPKLEEALAVMKSWNFNYRTNMAWVKDRFGTGYYFRGQHELLLIGVKGNIPCPIEKNRPPSVLSAPQEKHSEKPKEVYEIIEKMYPNRKHYLELFARPKVRRDGWVYWGLRSDL